MSTKTTSEPMVARVRIAMNLKRLYIELGLSQARMAELADFHRTYVSHWNAALPTLVLMGWSVLHTFLALMCRVYCDRNLHQMDRTLQLLKNRCHAIFQRRFYFQLSGCGRQGVSRHGQLSLNTGRRVIQPAGMSWFAR